MLARSWASATRIASVSDVQCDEAVVPYDIAVHAAALTMHFLLASLITVWPTVPKMGVLAGAS
jgi:hypothetical protein